MSGIFRKKVVKKFFYLLLCVLMFVFNVADGLYLSIQNFVADQNIVDVMWLAQNDHAVVDNFKTNQAQAAVAYQSAGALNYSGVSGRVGSNVAYPASTGAGDLLVLLIGMKPSTANSGSVNIPYGWTNITSLTGAGGYGVTLAADTGNTNVFAYYKVAEGTESGNLTIATNISSVVWMQMYRLSNTTQDWDVAGTTGQDTTTGTAVSIAMSADPGVTAGDFILGAMVIPTDVSTPSQFSAEAFTQAGVTFGAVTEIVEPDTTTGNDLGGFIVRSSVSSGTSSGAPTLTATAGGTTTNVMGPGIFIRIRATGTITYQTPGAMSGNTLATANINAAAYPASVAAGDLLLLLIGMKPSTANSGSVTTPGGWTNITSLTGAGGYATTLAADTGNTNVFAYYQVASLASSGYVAVSMATVSVSWAQIYRFNNSSKSWNIAATTGEDSTAGAVSIAMSADPGVTSGDVILGAMVIPTDVSTPSQFSAEAFTQSGITFGAVTEISEPDSGNGNDIGGFVVRSSASSGTSSGAPTMTATAGGTTTNVRGPGIFIRIREVPPTFSQSAYRFFANDNSTDVGTALAAQDTTATLSAAGDAFRLRLLLHVASGELAASAESFKLQFAEKSGTCDTGYTGETYTDVTAGTVIAYNDNSPADGDNLTSNANDPTHSGHTIVNQDYEELNNFTNSVAAIPSGQDGKWDFALFDNGATAGASYCLRVVLSSGSAIDTPIVVPEIIMAASTGVSISLSTDGSVNFGNLALAATQDNTATGVNDVEVVSVDTGPADLDIQSTVFTEGANTWVLGTSNDANQVLWEFATSTTWTIFANSDTPYIMSTNVAQSETRDIKLRITTPVTTDSYDPYSATITITASAP